MQKGSLRDMVVSRAASKMLPVASGTFILASMRGLAGLGWLRSRGGVGCGACSGGDLVGGGLGFLRGDGIAGVVIRGLGIRGAVLAHVVADAGLGFGVGGGVGIGDRQLPRLVRHYSHSAVARGLTTTYLASRAPLHVD
jgi:hypothetical protein